MHLDRKVAWKFQELCLSVVQGTRADLESNWMKILHLWMVRKFTDLLVETC